MILRNRSYEVVHIVFSLRNAGKENFLVDLINEQTELGNNIALIVINNAVDSVIFERLNNNAKVYLLNRIKAKKWSLIWLIKLYSFLFINEYKYIHCHDISLSKILPFIKKRKLYLTLHSVGTIDYLSPIKNNNEIPLSESKLLNLYGKIFAISNSVKETLDSENKKKCIVVYNGINTNQIRLKHHSKNQNRIVQVGNLYHNIKGQDVLIKALHYLIYERHIDTIRLTLIGDGSSKDYLLSLINQLSLQSHVTFLGLKDREYIYNSLCDYDIYIQPSITEGFGLSTVEAMCAGIPVVASNVEGLIEVTNIGAHGMLFEKGNYKDLAMKIEDVLNAQNSMFMKQSVINARTFAIENFDIRTTAKNYLSNY